MNRCQRKKQRRGEFQELGFALQFCTPNEWTDAEQDAFWRECIGRIEELGLSVGGGCGRCWDVFVAGLPRRSTVTAEQRLALLQWLASHASVSAMHAGELVDAWRPKD